MADTRSEDLRTHQRVRAVKLVQYRHFDPDYVAEKLVDDLGMGKTLDLSEGGLNFVCSQALPISWGLQLDLAFGADEIISVESRIVHVQEVADGRYRVGVRFENLSDEVRERIRKLVSERA